MGNLVTFDELEAELESETYPVSREYLLEQYGGYSLAVESGEESVETILERVADDDFSDATVVLSDIQAGVDEQGPEDTDSGNWGKPAETENNKHL